MRNKYLVTSLLVLSVLLVGACSPVVAPSEQTPPRTLNVNGNARVTAAPDIAYLTVGVHTEDANAAKAVDDNTQKARQIAEALSGMGVDAKDIQTSGFNIYPQDEFGPNGERTGTRFMVDNSVYITIRDVNQIGALLSAVVEAGANTVYGIQFDIEDKTALITEARKLAVDNAKVQAEELAAAAGVTLGSIQSINYYTSYPAPVADSKFGGAGGGVPVSAGQIIITADVSISYEIR